MVDGEDGASSSGHSHSSNTGTPQPQPHELQPAPPPPPPNQACAACKHQRRKCTPECELAPYFPADRPARFRNAHRLFGIKNILRIMKKANALGGQETRDDAATSVIYESDAREADPVFGAAGIARKLSLELNSLEAELAAVRSQVESFRRAAAAQQPRPPAPTAATALVVPQAGLNLNPIAQAPYFPPPMAAMMLQEQTAANQVHVAAPDDVHQPVDDYIVEPLDAVDAATITTAAERHEDDRAPLARATTEKAP
uniref:LOB domain-containing protein n=1 Tax=Leersia perrieri TaxID=77586 RepID=A0A0D9V262_9ORYZ